MSCPSLLFSGARIFGTLQSRNPRFLRRTTASVFPSSMNSSDWKVSSTSSGGGGAAGGGGGSVLSSSSNGQARRFALSPSSSLDIRKGDITAWFVDGASDTIVNAANERMLGGGGVDGAIHRVAGPELHAACLKVPEVLPGVRCPTGQARITPAFKLPVAYVIHTVGPVYDVHDQPENYLSSAFRNCLKLAKENNVKYIAFPAISCGVYGYPLKEASKIAISVVKEFSNDFKEVHFVLFSDDAYNAWIESANELL
ncbi:hypothetical protein QJS10_CPA03g00956 [Acorus calamus]|uniref:Macro domain-containing protein n=1 Tax=Acorus calamus TaxID=4465 RepID=A0AAV9FBJ5_ACOCL|nr:hypothetical protein QJS10_CPA03g00956 [Acorus calamus]